MHFTFVSIVVLVCLSTNILSHPATPVDEPNEPPNLHRARPLQQFFKNILNALRPTTTPEPPTTTRRAFEPASFQEIPSQPIPNFVDFSTYLLGGFASNNSAIKFTYVQPNASAAAPKLRGNYSVISFVVPHEKGGDGEEDSKGVFSYLSNVRLPWNRQPSDTDFSQFPPVLEFFTQRVQSYFSVYKYTDESRLNNTFVVLIPDDEIFAAVAAAKDSTTDSSPPIVQSDDGAETTTTDYLNLQEDTTTSDINSSEIE